MADDLPRRPREIQALHVRGLDQQLQEFNLSFELLTPKGRQWLKQWLTRADELHREVFTEQELGVSLRVHVDHVAVDPERKTHYEGHGVFSPAILLKAIEAWEKGEHFTPSGLVS